MLLQVVKYLLNNNIWTHVTQPRLRHGRGRQRMVLVNDFDDFYQRAVLLYRSDPSQVLLSFTFHSPRTAADCCRVLFTSPTSPRRCDT